MAESFTSDVAVAQSVSSRIANAGPLTVSAFALVVATPAYPWYSVPLRAGEVDLVVRDADLDVFFEEPLR